MAEEKKEKKKYLDFDIEDLLDTLCDNAEKDIKDFHDVINLHADLDRNICIGEIYDGIGRSVEGIIHFWNSYDEKHNIPIDERKPIQLIIDSPGGDLLETFIIIDAIKISKTPIHAFVIGTAYSGGFFIAISADKRYGYKHSSYLFHEGSAHNGGTSSQFENFTAFYKKQLGQLKDIVLKETNITEEEYERIKREDIWYDAYEALEKGIIDEIIGEN